MSQRAAFCVYSGIGVSDLRNFLRNLYQEIQDGTPAAVDTEYEDDDGYDPDEYREATPDGDVETGNEGDDDEDYVPVDRVTIHHPPNINPLHRDPQPSQAALANGVHTPASRGLTVPTMSLPFPWTSSSSRAATTSTPSALSNTQSLASSSRRMRGGFGHQPVIETSISPPHSEVASNRSTGTNRSNGAGFFRTYQEASSSSRSNGALTPDLNFAEIGHGRGAGHNSVRPEAVAGPSSHGISQVMHSSASQIDIHTPGVLADSSNAYRPVTWPHVQREPTTPPPSSSSRIRELHESVQSALGVDGREGEGRGRSVKRSLKSTFHFHVANSFLFGSRQPNGTPEGSRQQNSSSQDGGRESHGAGSSKAVQVTNLDTSGQNGHRSRQHL
jgi:F-box and leucine-rich repeat protein GRR1